MRPAAGASLTIVVPTRNRRDSLAATLAALEGQISAPPYEVCVVDNGSTDGTAAFLAEAAYGYPLRVLREPEPNRAAARNRGLETATGELCVFVDDDVLVPRNFLAAHVGAHRHGPPRVVTGPIVNVPDVASPAKPRWYHWSGAYFCTCNASAPTAALRAVGGFDEAFSAYGWEDTELGVRLRAAGLGHGFAWRAYVRHLKPPGWEPFDAAERRAREKGRMARRFLEKHPTTRVRLATGDHAVNRLRGALLGAPWTMAPARRLALDETAPAALRGLARAHCVDGAYREALREVGREGAERGRSPAS